MDKMLGKIRSCSLATLSLNAYLTSHQRCLVDSWILKPGVPGRGKNMGQDGSRHPQNGTEQGTG